MKKDAEIPAITGLNALILALTANLTELRISASPARRTELISAVNQIGEQLGADVVERVSLLIARHVDVVLTVFDGRGCSRKLLPVSTKAVQLIRLGKILPCEHCSELLVFCEDQPAFEPTAGRTVALSA